MHARWRSWLTCSLLVLQATPALCGDTVSAQERLEQARQLLLEQALKASTRVESLSWIDAGGRLQEHQSMRQAVIWPALQGQPAQRQASRDLMRETPATQDGCPADVGPKNLHPTLALQTHWPDRLPAGIQERLNESLRLEWMGNDTGLRHWRMHSGAKLPDNLGSYERWLLSPPAQNSRMQAQLQLELLDSPTPQTQRLAWRFAVSQQDRLLHEQRTELELPVRRHSWGSTEWTAEAWQLVHQQLQQWTAVLDQQLACVRPQAEVVASTGKHWTLNMGRLAGMRVGDEWALVDPAWLPERSLESGAIAQMVVARVERLEDMRAELVLVAGEATLPRHGWVAHPLNLAKHAQGTTPWMRSQFAHR